LRRIYLGDFMKKLLIFSSILFAFTFYSIQAQSVVKRVSQITSDNDRTQSGPAVDAAGNAYICGQVYDGSIDFGNSVILNFDTDDRGYLAKYDTDGNCVWALKILKNVEVSVRFNNI